MKAKAILWMVGLVVIIFLTLWILGLAMGQGFFFNSWELKGAVIRPDGLLQATLKNPDPKGEIKAVIVLVAQPDRILAYWFFENGEPKVFTLEGEQYVPDKETAKICIRCHNHRI